MYWWHLGHQMLLAGVLVSLSESSSSTTIGLWNEPTGAWGIKGPELFEEWEVIGENLGHCLGRWMGEGREDESDGITGGDSPVQAVMTFIPSHTLFLWTILWILFYRNNDLLISWSWSYLLILSNRWSYVSIHILWHVLDAYFGYYLHALDMC